MADKIQLRNHTLALRKACGNSKPFLHDVIDNIFSEQILDALLPEISAMTRDPWQYVQ
jgi:hypothetical protein